MKAVTKAALALAAALLSASPAAAGGADLMYLPSYDGTALDMFKCGEIAGVLRERYLDDGFDAYSGTVALFEKAGGAAVVKAALTAENSSRKPKVRDISFSSAQAERLVSADVAAHAREAHARLSRETFADGVAAMAACSAATVLDEARGLVDWYDNDVAVLPVLK
jgi:hypothetical protein